MKKFKNLLKQYKLDGYIIPKNDEYFNEYVSSAKDRLKFISNFSCSSSLLAKILAASNIEIGRLAIVDGVATASAAGIGGTSALLGINATNGITTVTAS